MKAKTLKRMLGIVLTAVVIWALAGCGAAPQSGGTAGAGQPAPGQKPKIKVVAAENFYGEVAQRVGGDRVEVTSILTNPEQDPHDYEPTADAAKEVADGQVLIYTGIGYDDWMDKLLKSDSSAQTKETIKVGADLLGKADGDNPHVWYDPSTMPKVANKLAEILGRLDPDHAQDYQKRAKDYTASLTPLTAAINKLKQSAPAAIAVSEPVFDYMADALNLKVNNSQFAKAIEDGNDPTAASIVNLQNDINNKKIKMFVYNIQTDSPTVENIAKLAASKGIPIVKVTETEPAGKDYLQWMTGQLDQVGNALGIQ